MRRAGRMKAMGYPLEWGVGAPGLEAERGVELAQLAPLEVARAPVPVGRPLEFRVVDQYRDSIARSVHVALEHMGS